MTAIVQKWGNSLAVRLPKAVADQIEVGEGQEVEMCVDGNSLVLRSARKNYKLSELLKGVTARNLHSETDWGKSKGKEIW
jgi:antitoxin MazE